MYLDVQPSQERKNGLLQSCRSRSTYILDDEGRSVMDSFFRHESQGVVAQQTSVFDTSDTTFDRISGSFIGIAMRCHQSAPLPDSAMLLIMTYHHSDRITNGLDLWYSELAARQFVRRRQHTPRSADLHMIRSRHHEFTGRFEACIHCT